MNITTGVQKAYLWFHVIFVLTPPGLLLLVYAAMSGDSYGLAVGSGLIISMFTQFALPVGLVVTLSYIIISPTWKTAFFIAQVLGIFIVLLLGFFNILPLPGIILVFLSCIQYVVFFTTVFRMLPKAN